MIEKQENQGSAIEQKEIGAVYGKIIEKIRLYFDRCAVVPLSEEVIRIDVPARTEEDKIIFTELLDLLSIDGWEDDPGVISIEGKYNIGRLRLFGLIDESYFAKVDEHTKQYNPFAYPLDHSFHPIEGIPQKPRAEKLSKDEEILGVDEELREATAMFDSGVKKTEESAPEFHEAGFLKRASKQYTWAEGRLYDAKTKSEISQENLQSLEDVARQGDIKALNEVVKIHIGLVYFVYGSFVRYFPTNDPDELLQAGTIGLCKAVEKNDRTKGTFSTYAVPTIEGYMRKAWQKSGPIHYPSHIFDRRNQYHLVNNTSIEPALKKEKLDILACELHFKNVQEMETVYGLVDKKEQFVAPTDNQLAEAMVHEYLIEHKNDPEQETIEKSLRKEIKNVLSGLTPREAKILYLRFFQDLSLEETARVFDVTRERIKQIEARALQKLRHPFRSEHLRTYLSDQVAEEFEKWERRKYT